MSNVFKEAAEVEIEETVETSSALEALVGEGKKFGDAESLAKGKLEADNFIIKLQQENAQLREQTSKQQTAQELLAELKADMVAKEKVHEPIPNRDTIETPEEKPDLAALVQAELDKQNKIQTAEKNIQAATEGLTEMVGAANVGTTIARKAKELGVSTDFLEDTARKSPKAFLSYFNSKPQSQAPAMTHGTVNTEAMQQTVDADASKIERAIAELKASTPKANRSSPEYQKAMMDLHAKKLGL